MTRPSVRLNRIAINDKHHIPLAWSHRMRRLGCGVAIDPSRRRSRARRPTKTIKRRLALLPMHLGPYQIYRSPIPVEFFLYDFTNAPEWGPLEAFTADHQLRSLMMYMGRECHPDTEEPVLFLHKHCVTRRYLYLDSEGDAFALANGHYRPCDKAAACQWLMV